MAIILPDLSVLGVLARVAIGVIVFTLVLGFLLSWLPLDFPFFPYSLFVSVLAASHVFIAAVLAFAVPVIDTQFLLNSLKTLVFLMPVVLLLKMVVFALNLIGIGSGT